MLIINFKRGTRSLKVLFNYMSKSQFIFLELLRAGLWDTELDLSLFKGDVDWRAVADIAKKQTVTGIVMDGIAKLPQELRPNKVIYFNLIYIVKQIEEGNRRTNKAIPIIMNELRSKGCDSLLQKGQGVAMNYRIPYHRQVGDIDLLVGFDEDAYRKACGLMEGVSAHVGQNNRKRRHAEFSVSEIPVEIHGNVDSFINRRCDTRIAAWAKERVNGDKLIFHSRFGDIELPPFNFDAVYIFVHMAGHYMGGGVGLRQVSDWMMYMNRNYDRIDMEMLKSDIEWLGIGRYWGLFAAMAVKYLGYPAGRMPFYDAAYEKKCGRLLSHIFLTGNFGALQKEKQLSDRYNNVVKKMVTFVGQVPVYLHNLLIFPGDTTYRFMKFVNVGLKDV